MLKADGHIRIPAALWKSVGAKPGQSSVVSDAVTVPETAQENA